MRTATAEPTSILDKAADATVRRVPSWVIAPPVLLALALGIWGSAQLSFWRDEGVTAGVTRRTVPEIFRFLGNLDAVHGTYYLLLHPLAKMFGTSEFVLRLPSALALAAAAAGVAYLGHRLLSPVAGLVAGLLYAGAPYASRFAHEARPYAIATALTVLATLLFVRAVQYGSRRHYVEYGCALIVLGMVHLFALLVVLAHMATLFLVRRERTHIRRWLMTVVVTGAVLSPLIALAATQRGQVGWLKRPGLEDVTALISVFAGSWPLVLPMGVAMAAGILFTRRNRSGGLTLAPLAVPWLLLPPAALLLISQIYPLYSARYVSMSLPALALLAAAGMTRLPGVTWALPLILVGAMAVPAHISQRVPARQPDHLREAAEIISRYAAPGDAIVYLPTNRRAVAEAYPAAFQSLRDVTLRVSPARAGNLGGTEVSAAEVRSRLESETVSRAWLLEGEQLWRGPTLDALNQAKVRTLEREFHQVQRWRVRSFTITLYAKANADPDGTFSQ